MVELRSVDPRTLKPNPNNPRRTAPSKVLDEQLLASVKIIGILQPPLVIEKDGELIIKAGDRRTRTAIEAGLTSINVIVTESDEALDAMKSLSENLVRAPMNSVDIWRGIEALEARNWTEQAIADALALPVRTIKRLKLLAHLPPTMLDVMAAGSMPNDDQLRTIAAASREEQTQVWKKHKPKKGQDVVWYEIARALSKRRIPFATARFDNDLARAYGVVWEDDLFAPADQDGRYTTNVEGFFGAQQEWLQNNLPERSILLPVDEYGRYELPKKAEHVYGKPGKLDHVGYYLDPHSGEVKTVAYRMPKPDKGTGKPGDTGVDGAAASAKARPDVTQKGLAMIGDLRTDALHQALKEAPLTDHTLIALLTLALAGDNVTIQSGSDMRSYDRRSIVKSIIDGGVLASDPATLEIAARNMLISALSCRENMSNSGIPARIAGGAINANLRLPNMATADFLACLSKPGVEKAARAEGVRVEARGKDTKARMVERFKDAVYVYPGARFEPTEEELAKAKAAEPRGYVPGANSVRDDAEDPGDGGRHVENAMTGDATTSNPDPTSETADDDEPGDISLAAD